VLPLHSKYMQPSPHPPLFHHYAKMFGSDYKFWTPALGNFLLPVTSFPSDPNISLNTLFTDTFNVCSSFNAERPNFELIQKQLKSSEYFNLYVCRSYRRRKIIRFWNKNYYIWIIIKSFSLNGFNLESISRLQWYVFFTTELQKRRFKRAMTLRSSCSYQARRKPHAQRKLIQLFCANKMLLSPYLYDIYMLQSMIATTKCTHAKTDSHTCLSKKYTCPQF
jgi:hypothetical protein